MNHRVAMFLLPFVVLGLARLGAEVSVRLVPMRSAWVPALFVYYLAIEGAVLWVRSAIPEARLGLSYYSGTRPAARSVALGVLLPALLPLGFFVLNVALVPYAVLGAIVVFAIANSYFEEVFWRGVMAYLPASDRVRIFYSGFLFAFSHWFFTGAYWLSNPRVLIPVVMTTFVMGVAWMWFYLRERSLAYTIASHLVVDVLNLSVAMFMGVQLRTV
jgi:membrane protease YdiL (CAAX protease family)